MSFKLIEEAIEKIADGADMALKALSKIKNPHRDVKTLSRIANRSNLKAPNDIRSRMDVRMALSNARQERDRAANTLPMNFRAKGKKYWRASSPEAEKMYLSK